MDDTTTNQSAEDIEELSDPTAGIGLQQEEIDPASAASMLLNIESMIKSHYMQIEQLSLESKKHQEMLEDIFVNDPVYQKHVEEAKEVNKKKNGSRQAILNRPEVTELATKVKGMKNDVKELRDALSDYLREYQRISGMSEIEVDGEIRDIVYSAKLVRKSGK